MSNPFATDCGPCNNRFLDKDRNCNERQLFNNWWREQICLYGIGVKYYQIKYDLDTHNDVYREIPIDGFEKPKSTVVVLDLNENAMAFQPFGMIGDDEVIGLIHIEKFYDDFGDGKEPRMGDVIELDEYGQDRPGNRSGKKFQITERTDQDVSQINQLQGHYVWYFKAKRFDYSYEKGITPENKTYPVTDDTFSGIVSSVVQPTTALPPVEKRLSDADKRSKEIFNYNDYGNNDRTYGDYY